MNCRCSACWTPPLHQHWGTWSWCMVEDLATHDLSSHFSEFEGWHSHHTAVNCIVQKVLTSAKVSSQLKPRAVQGRLEAPWWILLHSALEVWKVLVWDATCPDTFAPSHISAAAREAGAVAAQGEHLKIGKYFHLKVSHHLCTICRGDLWCAGPGSIEPRGWHWATSPSDDSRTKKQGVPPATVAKAAHSEGKCGGGAGDCREAWRTECFVRLQAA